MAVDLGDLIEFLQREVTPLGSTPVGDEEEYLIFLQNAFWHARLRGAFSGYQETDGVVTPIDTNGDDLPREQQQLIILMAGLRIVRSALQTANTVFRAQAGPVEFETQQSAQALKELLVQLNTEFKEALEAATSTATDGTIAYFDAVIAREYSLAYGDGWWVR